jgi:hypothetical protein
LPDVEPWQAELLRIDARYDGAGAIITIEGELNLATAARFLACIREAHAAAINQFGWPRAHVHRLIGPGSPAPCSLSPA